MKHIATSVVTVIGIGVVALIAAERFDMKVRNDFFAGFSGNQEALERGIKAAEETIAANPKHAEAKVWHGAGLFYQSGQYMRKGDSAKSMELSKRGLAEMEEAESLEPQNVAVLIPRGATLLTASRFMPRSEFSLALTQQGLADYEKTYQLQISYFDKLGDHPRGELLFGLAEGYARVGEPEKARLYFEKLAALGPASGHLEQAKAYLADGVAPVRANCVGCHVK